MYFSSKPSFLIAMFVLFQDFKSISIKLNQNAMQYSSTSFQASQMKGYFQTLVHFALPATEVSMLTSIKTILILVFYHVVMNNYKIE